MHGSIGSPTTAAEHGDSDDGARLRRRATLASVSVAGSLVVFKTAAWLATDSVALLSTLIDSLLDAGASLLTLFAVRHALEPADTEHRFGHGKAEALAGLGQAAFIAGSSFFLVMEAVGRFLTPVTVQRGEVGIAVMVVSILLTLALVRYQRHVIAKTGSVAINADSLHYTGDILINGSVMISLAVGMVADIQMLDPLFALGIAAYLLRNAWTIGMGSIHILMDRELPEEDRRRILALCVDTPKVTGVHDLRTRFSGTMTFIQLNLEMDGGMSLHDAHDVVMAVDARLREVYPNAEVLIHQDPAGIEEDHHPEFAFDDTAAASEDAPPEADRAPG